MIANSTVIAVAAVRDAPRSFEYLISSEPPKSNASFGWVFTTSDIRAGTESRDPTTVPLTAAAESRIVEMPVA